MTKATDKVWFGIVAQVQCCVLCGSWQNLQVAHRNEGKSMARKTSPWMTARLCMKCHMQIDSGRGMTRDERRSLMDRAIVLTHDALVRMGFLTPNPKGNGTCTPYE